jgi:hypothetical protein
LIQTKSLAAELADQQEIVFRRMLPTRYAILQPFYRCQFTHYTRIDRTDLLNSFGLALSCPITKQITLRTFVGYDTQTTDGFYVQNYQKLDAGAGLNLTVRF